MKKKILAEQFFDAIKDIYGTNLLELSDEEFEEYIKTTYNYDFGKPCNPSCGCPKKNNSLALR